MPDTVSYAKLRFSSYLELNLWSCWPRDKRKRERNRELQTFEEPRNGGKEPGVLRPHILPHSLPMAGDALFCPPSLWVSRVT